MPYLLCYTRLGAGTYPDHNYPGHEALLCDLEHALHLAISDDGVNFKPLRHNTGVLFPRCTFCEGDPKGTTKTLVEPWLTRGAKGFILCAIRRNQNAPDPLSRGCMMLWRSVDLVRYEEIGFLRVGEGDIRRPCCQYAPEKGGYDLSWEENGQRYAGFTRDMQSVEDVHPCSAPYAAAHSFGIDCCVPGNVIEVTEAEAKRIRMYLDDIRHIGVEPIALTIRTGAAKAMPNAVCLYSDGSTHTKPVAWDLSGVDFDKPGVYQVPGVIRAKTWPFPMPLNFAPHTPSEINDPNMDEGMSDPCVTLYKGKYYLSSTGNHNIVLRCADTVEGVFTAEPVIIHRVSREGGYRMHGTWAAELHEIDGVLYLFTTVCPGGDWTQVKSVVLRCTGDPLDESAWEAPRWCVKPNGAYLTEGGISLDMTWLRDGGVDYVLWSDRKLRYGTDPLIAEPADVYIATIDPAAPWQLTSEPVCLLRPMFGWDRCETEVEEAPYLLRRGDDLFLTVSGSSTGMSDLYCVGLLRAKSGSDLLNPAVWDMLPYPILTKESAPGEYGPGHNNFLKDPDTGDDLMVYHAVPHDEQDRTLNRHPALRRVHWAASGLPYLEMTAERDLNPVLAQVMMTLTVTE